MPSGDFQTRLRPLVRYFLRLGFLGFGGPVALIGQMERELVRERGWLTTEQMREAIAAPYAHLGGLRLVTAVFYGVSPAVIALILHSRWRLSKLGMDDWLAHRSDRDCCPAGAVPMEGQQSAARGRVSRNRSDRLPDRPSGVGADPVTCLDR